MPKADHVREYVINRQIPPAQEKGTTSSKDFMLAEYSMLRERFHSLLNEGVVRFNYFLTMTSVILGGFLLVGSSIQLSGVLFQIILLGLLIVLSVTGFEIFIFLAHRSRTLDKVERGMNRIRRYFVDQDPALIPYLIYAHNDEPTNNVIDRKSGLRTTIQVYQSFMVGTAVGIGMNFLRFLPWVSFGSSIITAIGTFWILQLYVQRFLHKASLKSKAEIRFPRKLP